MVRADSASVRPGSLNRSPGNEETSSGRDRIPQGTFYTLKYRTKDNEQDYEFSFEEQSDSSWRAYIVRQPSYDGRPDGSHPTHRLSDGGRPYVCWDRPVRTLAEMKAVAALWADCTQNYRKTGRFAPS
ncbi:MAG: hypothetical protein O2856_13875 [Planctomycetota bacterium]|nr:hypothetical protein [Planctomycetota bacterium]